MTAIRIIDNHIELANIGTNTHAQIDTHIADPSAHHTDHKVAQAESAEFKDINIPVGEAYKQATKIILRVKDLNTFVGEDAGKVTTGNYNNFIGYRAGYNNTAGTLNTSIGAYAGFQNSTGSHNTFIGTLAGRYETGSNKLFIDNQARANEADGRIKALIYGIFDAATANQRLRINGRLGVTEIPEYADNAAAVTGGLSVGEFYRTGDVLKIVH